VPSTGHGAIAEKKQDMELDQPGVRATQACPSPRVSPKQKFQLVTAVWGEWYVDVFLNFNIPSLLAPSNIPGLRAIWPGRYVIFTRRSDAKRIAKSKAFCRLSRCLAVELIALHDKFFEGNPHVIHVELWSRAARDAAVNGEWIAFISADTIFADGALGHLSDQFAAGKTIVYGFPLRVTEHTFMAKIDRLVDRSAEAWAIPARALMRAALENLSPLYSCYLRDGRRFGDHPELLLYPVPGEGLVLRIFVHHGLGMDPARLEFTETLSLRGIVSSSDVGFLTDSDLFASVSITPLAHQVDWFRERRGFSFIETARLWNRLNNAASPYLSRQSFRFHYTEMTPTKWRTAVARADNTLMLTFLTMKFVWAISVALDAGMNLAAEVMAFALLESKLHKSCVSRERITILVPTDDALRKLGGDWVDRLLAGPRIRLATSLRNHCLRGDLGSATDGQKLVTLAGREIEVSVLRGRILVEGYDARDIGVDDINGSNVRVYAYDAVIGELSCATH
jgi:hypothetical protein